MSDERAAFASYLLNNGFEVATRPPQTDEMTAGGHFSHWVHPTIPLRVYERDRGYVRVAMIDPRGDDIRTADLRGYLVAENAIDEVLDAIRHPHRP